MLLRFFVIFVAQVLAHHKKKTTPPPAYRPPVFETNTVQVGRFDCGESEIIALYEKCGWSFVNSYYDHSGGKMFTFQRDKNMPNYEKIKSLSQTATSFIQKPKTRSTIGAKLMFIFAILSLTCLTMLFTMLIPDANDPAIIAAIIVSSVAPIIMIGLPLLIGGLILRRVIKKKNKADIDNYYESKTRKENAVIECEKLVKQGYTD